MSSWKRGEVRSFLTRRVVGSSLFILLVLSAISSPSLRAQTHSLEGLVVDQSSGRAVADVRLQLQGPIEEPEPVPRLARSGSQGAFIFENLQSGRYRLSAERGGYFSWQQEDGITIADADVDLGELYLTPTRDVSGVARWTTGEPAVGIRIEVQRASALPAELRLVDGYREDGLTDDRGEFQVGGLRPGKYIVYAYKEASSSPERIPRSMLPVYYPGTPDRRAAVVIDLGATSYPPPLTLVLQEASGVMVTGYIEPSSEFPEGTEVYVGLALPYVAAVPFIDYRTTTGAKFVLAGVPPGSYELVAFSNAPPVPPGASSRPSGRHQESILVRPQGNADVRFSLKVNSVIEGSVELSSINSDVVEPVGGVRLIFTTEKFPGWCDMFATSRDDGYFQATRAFASEPYVLTLASTPADVYISEVVQGNRDLTGGPLSVFPSDTGGPVRVVLSDDGGSLVGSVVDGDAPVTRAFVVLAPANPDAVYWYRTARTMGDGSFQLSGVAPGDYRLLAFEGNENDEYRDPEFQKSHAGDAVRVRVEAGASYSHTLDVVSGRY